MLPDYHIHTYLCKHASGEPAEYKAVAGMRNVPEICFTDHIPCPDGYDMRHRMDISQMEQYRLMVTGLMNENAPRVLYGIEADYYAGCERHLSNLLASHDFDFVLGSVHFINDWGFDNPENLHIWDSVDVTATWKAYFKLIEDLADSHLFDAVSHLDLPKKFGHRPPEKKLKEMVRSALDHIAAAGMGIELNTSGLSKPVGEIYPSPLIVSLAWERDIPICFGSDAHRPDDIGKAFGQALKLARDAGYCDYFRIRGRKMKRTPLPEITPSRPGPAKQGTTDV